MNPHDLCDHRHLKPARLPIPPLPAFLMNQPLSRDCLIIITHTRINVKGEFEKNSGKIEKRNILSKTE